jgi:predicted dehydrogenase
MGVNPGAPLRVAYVGAGAMIREHARAFGDIPGIEQAGIWNRTRAKAEAVAREFAIAHVADNIDALYDRSSADLVVVAVYETAIHEVIEGCLGLPWAILMEKPVGLDVAEAKAIEMQAERHNARVMVGLNRRALSSTRAALDDLADDPSPRFIHVQDQQSLALARQIGHQPAVIRNWMYANSLHLVDYLLAFGRGAIEAVEVINPWQAEDPSVVLAKVVFTSGDLGLYEAQWQGPGPWACSVTIERRRWEMRPLERASFQNAGERMLNPVEPSVWDAQFKPGFRQQAEEVVRACRGGASRVPNLHEGVRAMQLVQQIYQS